MSRKKYTNLNFSQIISRIKEYKGITNDLEVANLLGLSKTAFSERKRRNSVPIDKITIFSERESISVDWFLFGEWPTERPVYEMPEKDNLGVVKEDKKAYTTRPTIRKIVQMLDEMGDDDLRGIFRYIEKEKLLKDLLEEKRARGEGKGT